MKGRRVKNTKEEEEEEKESAKRIDEKRRNGDVIVRIEANGAWLDARYFHVDGITVERYMDIHI